MRMDGIWANIFRLGQTDEGLKGDTPAGPDLPRSGQPGTRDPDPHCPHPDLRARRSHSQNVDLHPLTVILVLLIGGEILGVLGLLIAVPAAASVKIISAELYRNYSQRAVLM